MTTLREAAQQALEALAWREFDATSTAEESKAFGALITALERREPRREWVGLTDEEIDMIYAQPQMHKGQYARAIEAALKEKNA
jgi:hypothetical protein